MSENPHREPQQAPIDNDVLRRFDIKLPLDLHHYDDIELLEWLGPRLAQFRTLRTVPLFAAGNEDGIVRFEISRVCKEDTIQPEHVTKAVREILGRTLDLNASLLGIPDYFGLDDADLVSDLEELCSNFCMAKVLKGDAAERQRQVIEHRQMVHRALLEIPTIIRSALHRLVAQVHIHMSIAFRMKMEEQKRTQQAAQVQQAIHGLQQWIYDAWEDQLMPCIELGKRFDVLKDIPHPCHAILVSRKHAYASPVHFRCNDAYVSLLFLRKGVVEVHYALSKDTGQTDGMICISRKGIDRSNAPAMEHLGVIMDADTIRLYVDEPDMLEITPLEARNVLHVEWAGGDPLLEF